MKKFYSFALTMLTLVGTASCVNEWPHPEDISYNVTMKVHCDTDWIPNYDMDYTRSDGSLDIQYLFKIFKAGETSNPVKEFSVFSFDFGRADFDVDFSLTPGTYDVYVWSDICDASSGKSLFYDSSNFGAVTYLQPYRANSNNKDAFTGVERITIKGSDELLPAFNCGITLKRPLSRYIFMATDLNEFLDNEISRGKMQGLASRDTQDLSTRDLEEELSEYSIKVIYPLYMPSVFDVFTNKPYDSWTGVSFDGAITPLSIDLAELGMDYVMISVDPSSVQVALQLYDNDGVLIGGTPTINVPILRDRTTIISGKFLTSQEDAGIVINPDFEGQFNIEYH